MATLETAIALAVQAHQGQTDKSGRPYILHPLAVMMSMKTEEEMIVAVLHDVVEDSAITLGDLQAAGFSEAVVEAVDALSRRADESYTAFIDRISLNPLAVRVKLGDLESNMDIRRLAEVGEKEAKRLRKYLAAWQRLIGT